MLSLTPHSAQFFNIASLPFTPSGFVASLSTWSIPNGWLVEEARVQKPGTPGIPALAKADDLGTVSSAWRTISFKIQTLYHELALRTYLHIQTYPETGSFTTPSPSFFFGWDRLPSLSIYMNRPSLILLLIPPVLKHPGPDTHYPPSWRSLRESCRCLPRRYSSLRTRLEFLPRWCLRIRRREHLLCFVLSSMLLRELLESAWCAKRDGFFLKIPCHPAPMTMLFRLLFWKTTRA